MDNTKNDAYYVKRLLQSIQVVTRYLSDKSIDDLINDGYLCDAIENRFTKIAEDATNLSKAFKDSIKEIPWDGINSIRNRVCHNYDVVDFDILYKTIKINFPDFRKVLLATLNVTNMNLYLEPFTAIEQRRKTVEMRLFDAKRQKLKIGDLIVFKNTENGKELITEIVDIRCFDSFEKLYAAYKKTQIGYSENEIADPNDMLKYYPKESIAKYGACAIEIILY